MGCPTEHFVERGQNSSIAGTQKCCLVEHWVGHSVEGAKIKLGRKNAANKATLGREAIIPVLQRPRNIAWLAALWEGAEVEMGYRNTARVGTLGRDVVVPL